MQAVGDATEKRYQSDGQREVANISRRLVQGALHHEGPDNVEHQKNAVAQLLRQKAVLKHGTEQYHARILEQRCRMQRDRFAQDFPVSPQHCRPNE